MSTGSSGVDYQVLDVIKREATALAAATGAMLGQSGGREITESRGSTAYVFELNGALLAMVIEGLGTKSIIAADYQAATGTAGSPTSPVTRSRRSSTTSSPSARTRSS